MKIKLLLLTLFISTSSIFSQVMFNRVYGDTNWDIVQSVIPTYDKGYAVLVNKDINFQDPRIDILLIKTDSMGDTLWTKIYRGANGGYSPFSFAQTRDSGFIITGGLIDSSFIQPIQSVIIRTDKYGDTLWTQAGLGPGKIVETTDGGFAMFWCGVLTKLDSNGGLQWVRYYPDIAVYAGAMIQSFDGGYVMTGATISFAVGGPNDNDVYVIKTDSVGNIQWAKAYGGMQPEGCRMIQQTFAGDYVLAGSTSSYGAGSSDILFMKLDPSGDTLWSTVMGGQFDDYSSSFSQTLGSIGYVVVGTSPGLAESDSGGWGNYRAFMVKTDYNGNFLWAQRYGLGYNDGFEWVSKTWDNGFVLAGATGTWGMGAKDAWMVKTDAMGESGCFNTPTYPTITKPTLTITQGSTNYSVPVRNPYRVPVYVSSDIRLTPMIVCTSDTNWVGIAEIKEPRTIFVYPNPVNEFLNFNLDGSEDVLTIEIYNTLGQRVFSENTSYSQNALDVSLFVPGVYFLRVISSDNLVHTARFVKE